MFLTFKRVINSDKFIYYDDKQIRIRLNNKYFTITRNISDHNTSVKNEK